MELTGLTATEVLTVMGGFAAAVVVLYLLKLRRRQVEVPFVHLWQQVLAEKQTTRLFSTLKRLLSLLLALAVVAALAFAMGDPRQLGANQDGRTTVVLVDTSASMQAIDVSPSRMHVARRHIERLIEGLGSDDRLLVAQMDATTVPLTPLTSDARLLNDALDALRPTDLRADLGRGLSFALDVLRDQPHPNIVIVSDGVLDPPGPAEERARELDIAMSFIPVGEGGRNVAITAFSVRRYPLDKSRSQALVELYNPTDEDLGVELTLLGDDEPIGVSRIVVAAGERLRRIFDDVSGADRTLSARIRMADGSDDDQPADDQAYARLPERRRARVQAVSAGNLYLSAALLLDEYLEVTEVSPEQYPAQGEFDVTIFDNWVPPSPPDSHTIYLNPVPPEGVEGPFEITGVIERPFFDDIARDHPIVQFTALGDVNVAEGIAVEMQEGDRAIAADSRGPMIVLGTRNAHDMVAMLFDVRRSDLPLRVAWPLLLLNSIDHFVQEDDAYLSSYETGETWHVTVPSEASTATLVAPDGRERTVPVVDARAVCTGERAGFYRLVTEGEEVVFAANLGPSQEAIIEPVRELSLGGAPAAPPAIGTPGVRTEIWMMLVLLVLGVIAVEWFTYHLRLTV